MYIFCKDYMAIASMPESELMLWSVETLRKRSENEIEDADDKRARPCMRAC